MKREEWERLVTGMSSDVRDLNQRTISELSGRPAPTGRPDVGTNEPSVKRNALAARFENMWRGADGPVLTPEYRFAPPRKWRADYCHEPTRTIIELEGGVYSGGRHTRARGYIADTQKYNAAASLGFTVFRLATGFHPDEVERILKHIHDKESHHE